MSNMSYCRFQNTLSDLRDCQEALNEGCLDRDDELSTEEREAALKLIKRCTKISEDFGDN